MSARQMGMNCCGDRYVCNASIKCPCGCEVYYCRSCYETHCVNIVNAGAPTRGRAKGSEEVPVEQVCCEHRCTTREEMRIRHGDPQQFWEALLEANTDGFVTMAEAEVGQRRYEAIYNAAPETMPAERGYVEQWCPTCGTVCTSSTITKDRAAEYDKRCPKCRTETMQMQRWVKEQDG